MVTVMPLWEVNQNRQGCIQFNLVGFSFNLKIKNGKRPGYKK
jgi:hypothetical protein